jgi:riboflavin kinase / FMN adenylyltransferase
LITEEPVESSQAEARGRIVAIGNFDGVHRGHQAVLEDATRDAARLGLTPAVLTFTPHPTAVLGRAAPPILTRLPRKLELFSRLSPDIEPVVERFDHAFASQSPDAFAEQILVARLAAKVVVVGSNFRFGKARQGDFEGLVRLGERLGFETRTHALVGDDKGAWSSSRVREALGRGALDEATEMLGRPHMVSGEVTAGARRGRTIGFPTCNIEGEEALPPWGVYAVLVDREEGAATATAPPSRVRALAKGVANIGVRPTVTGGDARPNVEVHLFDIDEDLYGARLRVHLVAWLRPEQRFSGLDGLTAQIARDAEAAREKLEGLAPDAGAHGAFR